MKRQKFIQICEDKELNEDTSWWIRGIGLDNSKYYEPSIVHPLYLTNDAKCAFDYAKKHGGSGKITVHQIALTKQNCAARIIDLTQPDDILKIGYSPLLAKVFSKLELYFSWSMSSAYFNDRVWRSRELDFAFKFLMWKNGKDPGGYVMKEDGENARKPKVTLAKLVASKNASFPEATQNDIDGAKSASSSSGEFRDEYLLPRFTAAAKQDMKKATVLLDEYLGSLDIDVINAYIQTFKTIHSKWDSAVRKSAVDVRNEEDVPNYNDVMLRIFLQDIQKAGYAGYFCPEIASRKYDDGIFAYVSTTVVEMSKKVQTIALVNPSIVERVASIEADTFMRLYETVEESGETIARRKTLEQIVALHHAIKKLVSKEWKIPFSFEMSKQTAAEDAIIELVKDGSKSMFHVWNDKSEMQRLTTGNYHSVFQHLDMYLALDSSIADDKSRLLEEPMFKKIVKDSRLFGQSLEKWFDALHVEKDRFFDR